MSESVTIYANAQGYRCADHGDSGTQEDEVIVTTFYGGVDEHGNDRGRMVQITIGDKYVCMVGPSAEAIASVIAFASRNSVEDFPMVFRT